MNPDWLELTFWKKEWRIQCERYERAGGDAYWGFDFETENTLRDAIIARDAARESYRNQVTKMWSQRNLRRSSYERAA